MKKGEETRKKLVAATGALLQRQGFHATGLSDIVAESGAPRGSIYFYFPAGKEALACAALAEIGDQYRDAILALVENEPDPSAAIRAVCTFLAESLAASDYAEGCPLATVALEASTSSEAVRTTVAASYDAWVRVIVARLVRTGLDEAAASRLATFALSAIEGALLLAKVHRSKAPLVDAGAMLASMLPAPIRPSEPTAPHVTTKGRPRAASARTKLSAR